MAGGFGKGLFRCSEIVLGACRRAEQPPGLDRLGVARDAGPRRAQSGHQIAATESLVGLFQGER